MRHAKFERKEDRCTNLRDNYRDAAAALDDAFRDQRAAAAGRDTAAAALRDMERRWREFTGLVRDARREADFEPPNLPDPQDFPDDDARARQRQQVRQAARGIRRVHRAVSVRTAVRAAALLVGVVPVAAVMTVEWLESKLKDFQRRLNQLRADARNTEARFKTAADNTARLQNNVSRLATALREAGCRVPA